jgi:hypothetical protein
MSRYMTTGPNDGNRNHLNAQKKRFGRKAEMTEGLTEL